MTAHCTALTCIPFKQNEVDAKTIQLLGQTTLCQHGIESSYVMNMLTKKSYSRYILQMKIATFHETNDCNMVIVDHMVC